MISVLLLVGAVTALSLSLYFPVRVKRRISWLPYVHNWPKMQEHYSAFILSYMILSLASLSFVHAQIIRAWVICMKPCCTQISTYKMFWREPDLTTARHQRALWAASIGSMGLFLVLSGLTIIACIKPKLHTQIATVRTVFSPSWYATHMLHSSKLLQ